MARIIPNSDGKNKNSGKPEWLDINKLKKASSNELIARKNITIERPDTMKTVIVSYVCEPCKKTFSSSSLDAQKKHAARNNRSYLECPKCGGVLKTQNTIRAGKEAPSIVANREILTLKPGRIPNTWVDKAVYGRMVQQLGKFCEKLGMYNTQLRFQRGIRANYDTASGPKSAEFSIDYIDKNNTRNKIYATVDLTPNGEFVAPKTFHLASGVEFPFTKEAIDQLATGKLFDRPTPQVPIPRQVFRAPDMTRFPFATSKQTEKMQKSASTKISQDVNMAMESGIQYYQNMGMDSATAAQKVSEDLMNQGLQPEVEDVVMQRTQEMFSEAPLETTKGMGLIPPTATVEDYVKTVKLANYPDSENDLFSNQQIIKTFSTIPKQKRASWKETLMNVYNFVLASKHSKEKALEAALKAVNIKAAIIRPEVEPTVRQAMDSGLSYNETVTEVKNATGLDLAPDEWNAAAGEIVSNADTEKTEKKAELAQFQPGQVVDYMDGEYEVDRVRPDTGAVILRSRVSGDMAIVPVERQHLIMPPSPGMYSIEKNVKDLAKQALRDEETYSPLVDPNPDYSLAAQTEQSEPKFDMNYSEMDQGVLPEGDRNYTTMFRGSENLNLKKTASPDVGINPAIHNTLMKCVQNGDTFDQAAQKVKDETGMDLRREDWEEAQTKTASIKTAYISPEDGQYVVKSESGEELGKHPTKGEAQKQLQAIEISKHKEGTKDRPFDHQHPYEPKTDKFPSPDKKEMDAFDKTHPKKRADIKKTAEPTGYNNDGSEGGWPVEYDRCKKMLESVVRQNRQPIADLDLHALKDNKYSREEIIDFLKKMPEAPPATASTERKVAYSDLLEALNEAVFEGMGNQGHYDRLMDAPENQGGIDNSPFPENRE